MTTYTPPTIPLYCLYVLGLIASLATAEIKLNFTIQEEQPEKTIITILKNEPTVAERFTEEQLRQISFHFLEPTNLKAAQKYFGVEEWTGVVEFVRVLDRDAPDMCKQSETCSITLDIAIKPTEFFTIIHLEINIQDKNDNAPVFPEEKITASVTESASTGVLFPIVPASDPDSPSNGIVEYSLIAPELFKLEQQWADDGSVELQLALTSNLDREKTPRYTLVVTAKDGGTPPKSGSVLIDLIVKDENDNSPVFEKSVYSVQVWENSNSEAPLVTVRARDKDAGENGVVVYSFSKISAAQYGSMFTIGSESGEIRLVSALDYEEKNFISLTVIARDQGIGSQPAYATVQISVLDQNDHEPSINLYTNDPESGNTPITLKENSPPDTFVVHVSVRDLDAGDAGKVDCVIDDELHFHLQKLYEKEYNIITVTDIDHEITREYNLKLECYDYGQPSLTATVTVPVLVEDINDHGPVFEKSHYEVTINENLGRHVTVLRVVAHDEDSEENGRIVYMLDDDAGDDFQIDPSTGVITSVMNLDHEKMPFTEFHVIATDNGENKKSATALVSLTIQDVDDEPPKFEQKQYVFSIAEGLPAGSEVERVKATDKDGTANNKFTYVLDGSENDLSVFEIDPDTGMIFTKKPLDREMREVYHLMVVAQSDRIPRRSDTAQVDIHVTDKNDNQPLIIFPKYGNETIFLSNAVPTGYVVTTVEAEDPDLGDNAELSYFITQGNEDDEFLIKRDTGDIIVNKQLTDYDNVLFKLVIMVQDGGASKRISVQTLNILVTKMNFTVGTGGSALESSITTSSSYIPIIVGVVAGCILIALILIIIVVVMKRKHRKRTSRECQQYWSTKEISENEKEDDMPMTETPGSNKDTMTDLSFVVKSDLLKQPQLLNKDDSDSGCADVSHTESQGSSEDPDGFPPRLVLDGSIGTFSHSPPQRMESFSSWLHSENYNLSQKGKVYRVADQEHGEGSPSSTLLNSRKTVRFSEPQRPPMLPSTYTGQPSFLQPPPDFSTIAGYYGSYNNGYSSQMESVPCGQMAAVPHSDDGSILMVPSKLPVMKFKPEDGSLV